MSILHVVIINECCLGFFVNYFSKIVGLSGHKSCLWSSIANKYSRKNHRSMSTWIIEYNTTIVFSTYSNDSKLIYNAIIVFDIRVTIYLSGPFQVWFPPWDEGHVNAEGSKHCPCDGCMYTRGTHVYDRGIHEIRRPQPIPPRPYTRDTRRTKHQSSKVGMKVDELLFTDVNMMHFTLWT